MFKDGDHINFNYQKIMNKHCLLFVFMVTYNTTITLLQ